MDHPQRWSYWIPPLPALWYLTLNQYDCPFGKLIRTPVHGTGARHEDHPPAYEPPYIAHVKPYIVVLELDLIQSKTSPLSNADILGTAQNAMIKGGVLISAVFFLYTVPWSWGGSVLLWLNRYVILCWRVGWGWGGGCGGGTRSSPRVSTVVHCIFSVYDEGRNRAFSKVVISLLPPTWLPKAWILS